MNGFRKIFPIFLSHYATFFAKMAQRKVVPFDEFYYQLKLMHLFPCIACVARQFQRTDRYNQAYENFIKWCTTNDVCDIFPFLPLFFIAGNRSPSMFYFRFQSLY
jgi:hypothetical protein